MQNKSCIEIIGEIGDLLKESHKNKSPNILEDENIITFCNTLANQIGLTEVQTLYFVTIFSLNCNEKDAAPKDIAEHLNLPLKAFPQMYAILDTLIEAGFVFKAENYVGRFDYILTPEVKETIFKGGFPKQENLKTDTIGFGEKIEIYEEHIKCRRITISQAVAYYKRVATRNVDLPICELILNNEYRDEEIIIIVHLYYNFINGDIKINYNELTAELFRGYRERNQIRKSIYNRSALFFKNSIIQFDGENYESGEYLRFTEEGKKMLLGEDFIKKNKICRITGEGLIIPDSVPEVKLYLNKNEQDQIKQLTNALVEDNYNKIVDALVTKKLSPGICVIFYGDPGAGKTESVLQIAKKTNRVIKKVDLSTLKDKYVGESEKRIKAVFNSYRNICENLDKKPILLLNEADGVFGTRIKTQSSVDQMNNTIQNIILEEMENFNGILIATTNLQFNFDKAFERRFLFKIKFTPPTKETLIKIIGEKIPELNKSDISYFAENYKLTGGQVSNISRKLIFEQILNNKIPQKEVIEKHFIGELETLGNHSKHNKIMGFSIKK